MLEKNFFSRRTFVKGIGLAAMLPLLPKIRYAEQTRRLVKAPITHKILSCNIRVALPRDDDAGFGWDDRKDICIDVMREHKPDIICTQEVLENQNEDLKKAFPHFFSFGFEGPEMDAFKEGYHGVAKNPIFFSEKRYELISGGTYWLSETPHIGGSKSWGTARARHVNWVRLKDKKSSGVFRVLNVHLDHLSQEAREQQIRMLMEEANQYPDDFKQFLAGDFNASASNDVVKLIKDNDWIDSYSSLHGDAEPGLTVHSFLGEGHPKKDQRKKIDFIFSKGGDVKITAAEVIKDNENGRYPSDHFFVSAEVFID